MPQLSGSWSFRDVLRCQAQTRPHQTAFTFLSAHETVVAEFTYSELDRQARAIAAALQEREARGAPVLLLLPTGPWYVAALFGCFYAGAIAVPVSLPRPGQRDCRIAGIVRDSGARLALSSSHAPLGLAAIDGPVPVYCIATDLVPETAAASWRPGDVHEATPALLQYTSGSTTVPRGAVVTHGNLVHNQRMIERAFEHSERSTHVSWLPLFHDMGLANVLNPVFVGASAVLMPPIAFIQRPVRWLRAISRYRGATAMAPNFGYDLCVQTVSADDRAELDLRSWSLALNGAEPVRRGTLDRFARTFAPCGFRPEAFFPAYGLAEATVFVTGGPKTAMPEVCTVSGRALEHRRVVPVPATDTHARDLVACGTAWLDEQIAIVDPVSLQRCAADEIGEIWIAGPHVAHGYWGCSSATDSTFGARIAGTSNGPFLRTGDLGFARNGQLYVTGRLKNVIIIDGRNCYAEDIEHATEQSHPAVRPGHCAAFGIDVDNQERLVVVAEIERHVRRRTPPASPDGHVLASLHQEIVQAIRQTVAATHDVGVYRVVAVRAGAIPRTSSGKIQRHLCRAAYETGTLPQWLD